MADPVALEWSTEGCTIEGTTEVMGDRWSLLMLRELFSGIRRFDQLTVRTAIPRQVLTERLERLLENGILRREPYQEPGQRQRFEYRLTDKGRALMPLIEDMRQYGREWLGVGDESCRTDDERAQAPVAVA